jgi:hypothetical protein
MPQLNSHSLMAKAWYITNPKRTYRVLRTVQSGPKSPNLAETLPPSKSYEASDHGKSLFNDELARPALHKSALDAAST